MSMLPPIGTLMALLMFGVELPSKAFNVSARFRLFSVRLLPADGVQDVHTAGKEV
jgi:hypothetical protein